jgi:hypothetical protein
LIKYAVSTDHFKTLPLEAKLDSITHEVGFTLNILQRIAAASSKSEVIPLDSQITIATFEQGHLRIASETLASKKVDGELSYIIESLKFIEVGDDLAYIVRGIKDVAEPLLDDPTLPTGKSSIIAYYQESVHKDHGRSLDIKDMTQIARKLEALTAAKYPNQVGGFIQIATIEDGKASLTDPFPTLSPFDELGPTLGNSWDGAVVGDSLVGMNAKLNSLVIVVNSSFFNIREQLLDNIFFFNTRFEHVVFKYDGSPITFFDKTNVLSNCILVLTKNAEPSSPIVVEMKKNFPALIIRRESQKD